MELPLKERPKGGEEPVEQLFGEEHPRRTVSSQKQKMNQVELEERL